MTTYPDHNDAVNLDKRLRVLTSRSERARMLALEAEKEWGCITLFMSKRDLWARLIEAAAMNDPNFQEQGRGESFSLRRTDP